MYIFGYSRHTEHHQHWNKPNGSKNQVGGCCPVCTCRRRGWVARWGTVYDTASQATTSPCSTNQPACRLRIKCGKCRSLQHEKTYQNSQNPSSMTPLDKTSNSREDAPSKETGLQESGDGKDCEKYKHRRKWGGSVASVYHTKNHIINDRQGQALPQTQEIQVEVCFLISWWHV